MERRWIGFLTAAGLAFVTDVAILALLGTSTPAGSDAWWAVNFISIPWVFCRVPFIRPAFGDDNEPLARALTVYLTISSCLTWGGLGYWAGRGTKDSRSPGGVNQPPAELDPPGP